MRNVFWTCERTAVAPNSSPGVWEYRDGTWNREPLPNGGEGEVEELYCIDGSRDYNIWVAGKDVDNKIYVARKLYGGSWTRFATTAFPSATASVIGLDVLNDRMVTIDCADGPIYYNASTFIQVGGATRTMATNSIRRIRSGNNSDYIGIFSPNAIYDESASGTWQGSTDYSGTVGLPINSESSMAVSRYNPTLDITATAGWEYAYYLIIGRTAVREIWKLAFGGSLHKVVDLSDEHASVYNVPRKKIDTTKNHNVYYLTAKASGGAQFVYCVFDSPSTDGVWNQVTIAGIVPTGGFCSIADDVHLGCGTRYIFQINQTGGLEDSLQPTGADDTQVYSDVWGYQLPDVTVIPPVTDDRPKVDRIKKWTGGQGIATGPDVMATLFYCDGKDWEERTDELEHSHAGDAFYGIEINSMFVLNPTDAWFCQGGRLISYNYQPAYVYHFDGENFTVIPHPFGATQHWLVQCVHGIASNDIWFVFRRAGYTDCRICHWDGVTISEVYNPRVAGGASGGIIAELDNGDVCFVSNQIYYYDSSRDQWYIEPMTAYGCQDDYFGPQHWRLYTDGETIWFAWYKQVFKGTYGKWEQLYKDIGGITKGLAVFPDGDAYWFSDGTILNYSIDGEWQPSQSRAFVLYQLDPVPVLGHYGQKHLIHGENWITENYLNGMSSNPASQASTSEWHDRTAAWLDSSPEVTRVTSGDGGLVLAYTPETDEWIRMNGGSVNLAPGNLRQNAHFNCMLAFDLKNIWIGGGSTWSLASHGNYSRVILSHFDGRYWKTYEIPPAGIYHATQLYCLTGREENRLFIITSDPVYTGWYYKSLWEWDGTSWTQIVGLSSHGWADFGGYADNAADKCIVLPNGDLYIIGRYVHYLPTGSTKYIHGDVSDWQHEDPSGAGWYTGSDKYSDFVCGICYDGVYIYVAKTGQGIWRGTFGSWEKVYTFSSGESGHGTSQQLYADELGNVYYGSRNGIFLKFDGTDWSNTLIEYSPGSTAKITAVNVIEDIGTIQLATENSGGYGYITLNTDMEVNSKHAISIDTHLGPPGHEELGIYAVYGEQYLITEPYVVEKDPAPDSTVDEKSKRVEFSIRDTYYPVVLSSILIYIRGELVYSLATGFTKGWQSGSSISANSFNGYDLKIQPAKEKYWHTETVKIGVNAINLNGGVLGDSWDFHASTFPFKIYRMLAKSIQNMEEN